ncbi:MAG: hypothetical protein V7K47_20345 [Nostoc sp.]
MAECEDGTFLELRTLTNAIVLDDGACKPWVLGYPFPHIPHPTPRPNRA